MAFKIIKQEGRKKTYEIGGVPYSIVETCRLPSFENLELSKRIYNYPEKMFCPKFFKLFLEIKESMKEQVDLFAEIGTFSKDNIMEVKFIKENLTKIKENAQICKHKLNKFLTEKKLPEISDCMKDDKISQDYIESYYKKDLWFEVFCYYMVLKYIQEKKNSYTKGKDFEIILSQDIKGTDFQHQIDLIILVKNQIILGSCKSGSAGRTEILSFNEKKRKINVALSIVFFFKEFREAYNGSHDRTFIIQNIQALDFGDIKKGLGKVLDTILR